MDKDKLQVASSEFLALEATTTNKSQTLDKTTSSHQKRKAKAVRQTSRQQELDAGKDAGYGYTTT